MLIYIYTHIYTLYIYIYACLFVFVSIYLVLLLFTQIREAFFNVRTEMETREEINRDADAYLIFI